MKYIHFNGEWVKVRTEAWDKEEDEFSLTIFMLNDPLMFEFYLTIVRMYCLYLYYNLEQVPKNKIKNREDKSMSMDGKNHDLKNMATIHISETSSQEQELIFFKTSMLPSGSQTKFLQRIK